MKWNWQQSDWPNFRYDAKKLAEFEAQLLKDSGMLFGVFRHLDAGEKERLTIELISTEAFTTSEIEGEYLDRESVQSSIRRQFGLSANGKKQRPAERGIAEMMVDLYNHFDKSLSADQLFFWHRMVMAGHEHVENLGKYRTHNEPMQVVSGRIDTPTVHFEAPPSKRIPAEMEAFLAWFTSTEPQQKILLPALARAGIAHLYFVSIHPFEDGNGRIARALSEKALSQALGQPTLFALAQTIGRNKKAYYDALSKANKTNDVTEWLLYFASVVLAAQKATMTRVEFLLAKTKLYARLQGKLNQRQEKTLERLFEAGPEGFVGGLSAENYLAITGTSRATATRDLQELVEFEVLKKTGERKGTRYFLIV
ncbi:MAG: Fic family protein [bacterium]